MLQERIEPRKYFRGSNKQWFFAKADLADFKGSTPRNQQKENKGVEEDRRLPRRKVKRQIKETREAHVSRTSSHTGKNSGHSKDGPMLTRKSLTAQ
jgi:hypothetical protein